MRLQVNLIPALGYALVMMFSNHTGISGTVEKASQKQQIVSIPSTCREYNPQNNHLFVAKDGKMILPNGFGMGTPEWKIPYRPATSCAIL